MSSAVTTLTCARRIPIPIPEPERPRTVRRTPRIGDNGTPSAHMGQLVRRRPPRDDLTPNQVLREPPDRRQRSRPIVHLLDADVDVTGAAPHGRVVKMAVQVHAPLRDPTEGEVRHQQRRVAVRRRARCIARRSPARRPPRCRVHGCRTRESCAARARPPPACGAAPTARRTRRPRGRMIVPSGRTVRRHTPNRRLSMSSGPSKGRPKTEIVPG